MPFLRCRDQLQVIRKVWRHKDFLHCQNVLFSLVHSTIKLTPNKRLDHKTRQGNAMQRCLLKPWKIYNYTKAVCKLLLDLVQLVHLGCLQSQHIR